MELKDDAGNITYGKGGSVYIDYTLPTVGASGAIYTANKWNNGLRVTWTAASDNKTSAANLKYQVYYSTSATFSTVAEVKAGTAANSYTANITQFDVTSLSEDTTYYFNVLVQDEAGNETAYVKISDKTNDDNFMQVSVGYHFACGLTGEGKIYCWGDNVYGKLGDGTTTAHYIPQAIDSSDRFKKVSTGTHHACALRVDNRVLCWGYGGAGRLGNNSSTDQASPVLISGTDTYIDVAAGDSATCAVRTDGIPFCWGRNTGVAAGALGMGSATTDYSTPVQVSTITEIKSIVAGKYGACALKANGAAYCWGDNGKGELGDGTTTRSDFPVAVAGGLKFKQLTRAAYGQTTCGLTSTGAAYCWGDDASYQLGDDGVVLNKTTPVAVQGGLVFRDLSIGHQTVCGITDEGTTYCWGFGGNGALGNSTSSNIDTPSPVTGTYKWRSISAGLSNAACGIADNGRTYCWGNKTVANKNFSNTASPILLDTTNLSGDAEYMKISGGYQHSCGLKTNGKVYCWGDDASGFLGNGPGNSSTTNHLLAAIPERVIDVNAGYYVTCAIASSGNLYCWGLGLHGNVGIGNISNQFTPVQIGTGSKWLTSTGNNGAHCALTSQGKPYCWGYNVSGNLGRGHFDSPELTPGPVSVGADVYVSIASGANHTCGIIDTGITKCWGQGTDGQLGNGASVASSTPVSPDATLTRIIEPGGFHTCRIKATGALDCWGKNSSGQLGRGNTTASNIPVDIDASYHYTSLAGSHTATCGTRADATVYCWGDDSEGAVGDNTSLTNVSSPIAIAMTSPVRLLQNGGHHFFAITGTGAAYGWGQDTYDQLGSDIGALKAPVPRMIGRRITGTTATASSAIAAASNAVDGDTTTRWESGGYAVKWIEIDLKKTARVRKVRLTPSMAPSGTTTEEFYHSLVPGASTLIGTSTAGRTEGVAWDYVIDPAQKDVRFLRVQTTSSPSWVSIYEIEVYE